MKNGSFERSLMASLASSALLLQNVTELYLFLNTVGNGLRAALFNVDGIRLEGLPLCYGLSRLRAQQPKG